MVFLRLGLIAGGFALFTGVVLVATTVYCRELHSGIVYDPDGDYYSVADDDCDLLDSETSSVVSTSFNYVRGGQGHLSE